MRIDFIEETGHVSRARGENILASFSRGLIYFLVVRTDFDRRGRDEDLLPRSDLFVQKGRVD